MFANEPPSEAQTHARQAGGGDVQPSAPPEPMYASEFANKPQAPVYHQPPVHQQPPVAYGTPVQGQALHSAPPPTVAVAGPSGYTTAILPHARIPFYNGMPQPAAPPGYVYVYHEQVSPIAILLCIVFFPWGILFLLCMKEQYWQLTPVIGPTRH